MTEEFDTSTAPGRLRYHVLGAVAEFERDIKERTFCETAKRMRLTLQSRQNGSGLVVARGVETNDPVRWPSRTSTKIELRFACG
jgi:hypothetical protein